MIALDSSTGLVKGLHFRGWAQGSCNNLAVDLVLDYHYELSSYSLPRFHYGTFPQSPYLLLTIIPSVFIVLLVPLLLYIRKRKRKEEVNVEA